MADRHDIMWYDCIDSTNEEVRRHIDSLDNLSVVSALSQTAGRGQRGNTWTSAPGDNLTFSVLLKFRQDIDTHEEHTGSYFPCLKAIDQSVISEIAALSLVEFLHEHEIEASIKWPNDIYVGKKKICGVLIENKLRGNYISHSILGIGLNINQRNFDVNLPNPTSMLLESPKQTCFIDSLTSKYDIHSLLEEFMDILTGNYRRNLCKPDKVRSCYLSRLWRLDTPAQFIDKDGNEFTGIIRGLSPIGNILIEETKANSIKEFAFKEISYII